MKVFFNAFKFLLTAIFSVNSARKSMFFCVNAQKLVRAKIGTNKVGHN